MSLGGATNMGQFFLENGKIDENGSKKFLKVCAHDFAHLE